MSYVTMDERPVDFILFQYGNSKNLFRGPKKSCKHTYGVYLGGADTFGGKVPDPFSAMLEREMGMPILNLGAQHSGAGFYIEDDMQYTRLLKMRRLSLWRPPVSSINPIRFTVCILDAMIDL